MALARYPNLQDATAVKAIEARMGGEAPREFFIRRFSEGVARIAAAFYPKPVIVRTSDFKTNEYAALLGGAEFEPRGRESDARLPRRVPLLRRAVRRGFALECAGLLRVRRDLGSDQRQDHDPVLPHGRRGPASASPPWLPTGSGRARTASRST